jgi:beta-N-acetylhexosaminidase
MGAEQLASMSVKEKVGQLYCNNIRDFSDHMLNCMFEIAGFGAVMFWESPLEEALDFTEKIQGRRKIPVLIAANLEKGGCDIVWKVRRSVPRWRSLGPAICRFQEILQCSREGAVACANWAFAYILDIDLHFS